MVTYRIYVVTEAGHIAEPPTAVQFADDEAVLAHAKQLLCGRVIEVWERARLVHRLEPPTNETARKNALGET
jgi:hypothetical protein